MAWRKPRFSPHRAYFRALNVEAVISKITPPSTMTQESAAAPHVEKKDVLPKADTDEKRDEAPSKKADTLETATSELAQDV